ncbi:hypothetical protein RCL1_000703 [Eukaryota sp. TZLM3-RCL]
MEVDSVLDHGTRDARISITASPNPLVKRSLNINDEPLLLTKLQMTERSYWEFFFLTLACFSTYASMFFFQRHVSQKCQLDHGDILFGVFMSFLPMGNLLFRLIHNVLLSFWTPRHRLCFSMFLMAFVEVCLFSIFFFQERMYLWQVAVLYGLAGAGIGNFEANLLNVTTPYGPKAKLNSLLAIPIGIATITVFSLPLMLYLDWEYPTYIYLFVCVLQFIGIILLVTRIPIAQLARQGTSASHFFQYLGEWRAWFPQIIHYAMSMGANMFSVSMFSPGLLLYIFTDPTIVLNFFNRFEFSLRREYYFSCFSTLFAIGDFYGRKFFAKRQFKNPYTYWVFTVPGVAFGLSKIPSLSLFAGIFIAFGNGGIYTSSAKNIDAKIDSKYNGIAGSVWLFIADMWSVAAYILTQLFRDILIPPHETVFIGYSL